MPIPSKPSEIICKNLRSVTPPIDYPVENGGVKPTQCSFKNNVRTGKVNGDIDDSQEQVLLYIDGRRIIRKKKRKCIKCK